MDEAERRTTTTKSEVKKSPQMEGFVLKGCFCVCANRFRHPLALMLLLILSLQLGCRRGSIVATVNGKPITREEFERVLESRHGVATLITLIDRRLLSEANRSMRLVDEFRVNRELRRRIDEMGGMEQFKRWLRMTNMTLKLVKDEIREQLVLDELRSIEVSKMRPSDKQLRLLFETLKKVYSKVQWVKLRVIETPSEEDAQSFYEQLKHGASFESLASRFNIREEMRSKHGELGALPLDTRAIDDRLLRAVSKLNVGQVSKPFEMGNLWVIVKLEDVMNAEELTLDLVRPFVEAEYRRITAPTHDQLMQKLRQKASVHILIDAYKEVEKLYGRNGGK
jgi:peptidyl-prolyl cis-trans isomerase C